MAKPYHRFGSIDNDDYFALPSGLIQHYPCNVDPNDIGKGMSIFVPVGDKIYIDNNPIHGYALQEHAEHDIQCRILQYLSGNLHPVFDEEKDYTCYEWNKSKTKVRKLKRDGSYLKGRVKHYLLVPIVEMLEFDFIKAVEGDSKWEKCNPPAAAEGSMVLKNSSSSDDDENDDDWQDHPWIMADVFNGDDCDYNVVKLFRVGLTLFESPNGRVVPSTVFLANLLLTFVANNPSTRLESLIEQKWSLIIRRVLCAGYHNFSGIISMSASELLDYIGSPVHESDSDNDSESCASESSINM